VYAFVITLIILKALDVIMGIRVTDEEEGIGLDMSQHGELPYADEPSFQHYPIQEDAT
jgi:Amt family ammonium transporter